jgi:hypothetical protein
VLLPTPSQQAANRVRWHAGRRDFYEVHYIQWWDHENAVAGWLRSLLFSSRSGRDEAAIWAGVIDLANPARSLTVKHAHTLASARIADAPFRVAIGQAEMTNGASAGSIDEGPAAISWSVAFDTPGMEIAHIPAPLGNLPIPPTKFVSGYCGGRLSGWIEVAGKRYATRGAPAVQSHFWGPKNVVGWSWGHCANFHNDPGFIFDGVFAATKLGGVPMKPLNIFFFRMDGIDYRCNGLAQALFGNASTRDIQGWRFTARSGDTVFRGEVTARPEEMCLWRHEDPDGDERLAHLTVSADYKISVTRRVRGADVPVKTVMASRTGIYEITLPGVDDRVAHRHPTHLIEAPRP